MKKLFAGAVTALALLSMPASVSAAANQAALQVTYSQMKPALIVLVLLLGALALCSVLCTVFLGKRLQAGPRRAILAASYLATAVMLVFTLICWSRYRAAGDSLNHVDTETTQPSQAGETTLPPTQPSSPTVIPTEPTESQPPVRPPFVPSPVDSTRPENWGIQWEIIQHGAIVDSFQRTEPITFGDPEDYFVFPGVPTFRGNNYRNSPTYGTANVVNETITTQWQRAIGSFNGWPGAGWTGQPLMVRWDQATKDIMQTLYPEKKAKADLVEVIYATLDGNIYFYDLDDGTYTRDPIPVQMNFKGAGALDPRGYPLMYVGSGDYVNGKVPRMYIISLIDGSILFERSGDDAFTLRRDWAAFDSSPLVDAETDTLIWPGESGILYTIKLNTVYDPAAGTISVSPEDTVKTRYAAARSSGASYWLGYEDSAVIVDHYLYVSENGGLFFCVDLNTMELIWTQDTMDDSNSTPVFQWDESGETGYLYTAPSIHWTQQNSQGDMNIYKLNAKTGEIVWTKTYHCYTMDGVSGGVQSTPLLGKPGTDIENLIFYSVARTPNMYDGCLVALDTETGEVVWEMYMDNYAWSSPAAVYTESGKGYVVICDSAGIVKLLDGATGEVLSYTSIGSNVEASPSVFGDTLVVGTRGGLICGLKVE